MANTLGSRKELSTEEAYRLTAKAALKGITITATPTKDGWLHTWTDNGLNYIVSRDNHGFIYLNVNDAIGE